MYTLIKCTHDQSRLVSSFRSPPLGQWCSKRGCWWCLDPLFFLEKWLKICWKAFKNGQFLTNLLFPLIEKFSYATTESHQRSNQEGLNQNCNQGFLPRVALWKSFRGGTGSPLTQCFLLHISFSLFRLGPWFFLPKSRQKFWPKIALLTKLNSSINCHSMD